MAPLGTGGGETRAPGAQLAFGASSRRASTSRKADVILSFDSDFLTQGPGAVRYAREFARAAAACWLAARR